MKFSVFAIAALAAATSPSCFVLATATTASRKRKITKKNGSPSGSQGATGPTGLIDCVPIGDTCVASDNDCAVPPGLNHGVCRGSGKNNITCQSGEPGSYCGVTSDCVVPPGLNHAVCRDGQCQSGASGSSCGATSDCVVPSGLEHAVCRQLKCQRGVCGDYCGQDSDCLSGLYCDGKHNTAKCWPSDQQYVSCQEFNNAQ